MGKQGKMRTGKLRSAVEEFSETKEKHACATQRNDGTGNKVRIPCRVPVGADFKPLNQQIYDTVIVSMVVSMNADPTITQANPIRLHRRDHEQWNQGFARTQYEDDKEYPWSGSVYMSGGRTQFFLPYVLMLMVVIFSLHCLVNPGVFQDRYSP
jgi:hypothetical protein